jgi:hypothetical protein
MTDLSDEHVVSLTSIIDTLTLEDVKEAIEQLQSDGITSDEELPFLRTTYNRMSDEVCEKLHSFGLLFMPKVIGTHIDWVGNVYAIFDPEQFTHSDAIEWLNKKYKED